VPGTIPIILVFPKDLSNLEPLVLLEGIGFASPAITSTRNTGEPTTGNRALWSQFQLSESNVVKLDTYRLFETAGTRTLSLLASK
jgi:hypothetical protein